MGNEPKSNNKDEQNDELDAMAALISGVTRTSQQEARRRLDWFRNSCSENQRVVLEKALSQLKKVVAAQKNPEHRHAALHLVGRLLALKAAFRAWAMRLSIRPTTGKCMLKIASLIFSKKKVERVFTPLVADYVSELEEVRDEGALKIIFVKLAWWYRFWKACGFDIWLALAGKIIKAYLQ
jgi:hypothetical protein